MRKDQRRFERVPASFRIVCRRAGALAEAWREVFTVDLSAGGISFQCEEHYEPEERLEIQIDLPGFRMPLVLLGRVVRSHALAIGTSECAIELADVTPDQQVHIDEMVQFLRQRPSA